MKGITPLMASVLLIAFTLAVAAIIGSWLTTMTKTETLEVESSLKTTVNCSKGVLDIVEVTCEGGWVDLVINNVGSVDLPNGFSTYAIDNSSVTDINESATTDDLPAGSMMKIEDSVNVTPGHILQDVRITSLGCPSVSAEKSGIGITC